MRPSTKLYCAAVHEPSGGERGLRGTRTRLRLCAPPPPTYRTAAGNAIHEARHATRFSAHAGESTFSSTMRKAYEAKAGHRHGVDPEVAPEDPRRPRRPSWPSM